jgi:hypothetical protein
MKNKYIAISAFLFMTLFFANIVFACYPLSNLQINCIQKAKNAVTYSSLKTFKFSDKAYTHSWNDQRCIIDNDSIDSILQTANERCSNGTDGYLFVYADLPSGNPGGFSQIRYYVIAKKSAASSDYQINNYCYEDYTVSSNKESTACTTSLGLQKDSGVRETTP